MGLDDFLGAISPIVGGIAGSFFGPAGTAIGTAIGGAAGSAFFDGGGQVTIGGGGMPPYSMVGYPGPAFSPQLPIFQDPAGGWIQPAAGYQVQGEGAAIEQVALPAAPIIMGLTRTLALTISKLAGRLGIAVLGVSGLSRVGARIWRSLFTFARRHPNISVLSMLTALGLTVEEASEYIAWGSTRRRRRRGGISTRDMRVARRVIRRIRSFQSDLGGMARGRRRFGREGGVSVVRAG